jgi:peptidoglycan/LPS O-acetylase OafA/YrhL
VVSAFFLNPSLCRFLSAPVSQWLGKISFPLYLVHFPVLVSYTSGMIVLAHADDMLNSTTIWFIASSSVLLCVLVAVLFLPVERLTASIGRGISQLLVARASVG